MITTRRKVVLALVALLLLVMTACGGNNNAGNGGSASNDAENAGNAAGNDAGGNAEPAPAKQDPFGKLPEFVEVKMAKPVVDNPVNMPEGETLTANRQTKWVEDTFGVKLNYIWTAKTEAYDQKLKLSIASNDLPDIFVVQNYSTFLELLKNDMIEDLSGVYEQFASDRLREVYASDKGKALEMLSRDGKLYGLSGLSSVDNSVQEVWLRQDLLEKNGLAAPKTVSELRTVVKTLNEKEGTTGIPGNGPQDYSVNPLDSFDSIFQALHAKSGLWVKGADGSIAYGSTLPETKAALGVIREMYEEGTIDKEFATSKPENVAEKVASGKAAAYLGPWWSGWYPLADAFKNDPKAVWRAYLLEDDTGTAFGRQEAPTGRIAVVKKGFKYPELLVKILNFQTDFSINPYGELETLPDNNTHPVNIQLWDADLVLQYHQAIMAYANGQEPNKGTFTQKDLDGFKNMAEAYKKGDAGMGDLYPEVLSRTVGFLPIATHPNFVRVYSDFFGSTPTMEKRWANLKKLENDAFLQIVLGNKPLDYFDEFVKNWNDQGGADITKEINEG